MAFSEERLLRSEWKDDGERRRGSSDTIMPSLEDDCHQIRPWRAREFPAILSGPAARATPRGSGVDCGGDYQFWNIFLAIDSRPLYAANNCDSRIFLLPRQPSLRDASRGCHRWGGLGDRQRVR